MSHFQNFKLKYDYGLSRLRIINAYHKYKSVENTILNNYHKFYLKH